MTDSLAGKRILVVEDEYFIATDLRRALAAEGATVVGPAPNLDKALSLAAGEPLDAALLDVNLEGENSYTIADRLSERSIPYLFLTGYDAWSMPEPYRDVPHVAKPFSMSMVVESLARLVGEAVAGSGPESPAGIRPVFH